VKAPRGQVGCTSATPSNLRRRETVIGWMITIDVDEVTFLRWAWTGEQGTHPLDSRVVLVGGCVLAEIVI